MSSKHLLIAGVTVAIFTFTFASTKSLACEQSTPNPIGTTISTTSAEKSFDAEAEADKLCGLAQQALNQPTAEGSHCAKDLLESGTDAYTAAQLKQIATIADKRYQQRLAELKAAIALPMSTPEEFLTSQRQFDKALRLKVRCPLLSFVEAEGKIFGVTFQQQEGGRRVFVLTYTARR